MRDITTSRVRPNMRQPRTEPCCDPFITVANLGNQEPSLKTICSRDNSPSRARSPPQSRSTVPRKTPPCNIHQTSHRTPLCPPHAHPSTPSPCSPEQPSGVCQAVKALQPATRNCTDGHTQLHACTRDVPPAGHRAPPLPPQVELVLRARTMPWRPRPRPLCQPAMQI